MNKLALKPSVNATKIKISLIMLSRSGLVIIEYYGISYVFLYPNI